MTDETIAEVGIDAQGQLYVRPSSRSFEHIWRAAMQVNWDESARRLFAPKPQKRSYVDWFRQIVAAPEDEYGTRLSLTSDTVWSNVPASVRAEIEALPRG